ncbi:retinal maintenance-domain-containing protein [Phlyctochytrium arcticum]|nr:retinal maintenance-domain-containing protein [Phlyctochytrium arcticum]
MDDINQLLADFERETTLKETNLPSNQSTRNADRIHPVDHLAIATSAPSGELQDYAIDDLLKEFDVDLLPSPVPTTPLKVILGSEVDLCRPKSKCAPVCIGGSRDERGLSLGSIRRTCTQLRCSKCDFKCVAFPDASWTNKADYLFFRNHMPNTTKLQDMLVHSANVTAYCCQCTWKSIGELTSVNEIVNLKWFCGGHSI